MIVLQTLLSSLLLAHLGSAHPTTPKSISNIGTTSLDAVNVLIARHGPPGGGFRGGFRGGRGGDVSAAGTEGGDDSLPVPVPVDAGAGDGSVTDSDGEGASRGEGFGGSKSKFWGGSGRRKGRFSKKRPSEGGSDGGIPEGGFDGSRGGFRGGNGGSGGGQPGGDSGNGGGQPGGDSGSGGGSPVGGDAPISDTPTDPNNLSDVEKESLDVHNRLRAGHGHPALVWDPVLAEDARRNANRCDMEHDGPYGQNLAAGYSSVRAAIEDAWYESEKASQGGHYTQVIWKSSQKLGCALVSCSNQYGNQYTCNYYPPGNVQGQYPENT